MAFNLLYLSASQLALSALHESGLWSEEQVEKSRREFRDMLVTPIVPNFVGKAVFKKEKNQLRTARKTRSLTEKDSIVFRENPNYWNKDNVRLKTVTWRFRDSSDELKDYGMTKAGELDSCSLSTAAAVAEAVTDGLFDKYACPAGTDAPSCMAFFNACAMPT